MSLLDCWSMGVYCIGLILRQNKDNAVKKCAGIGGQESRLLEQCHHGNGDYNKCKTAGSLYNIGVHRQRKLYSQELMNGLVFNSTVAP